MEKFTITITREFGSLGRSIAKELSRELGVEFYDRDIVEEVAKKLNLPVSTVSDEEEKSKQGFLPRMFPLGTDEAYIQDIIFDVQKDIILDLARKSSCILVGRCSDYLLEHEKNNINIFIYAPYGKRLENCVETLGMTESEAKRMIASVDRARNAYHKKYAGYLPGDPEHKNLMIDSSLLGVTGTAMLIAEIVRRLYGE
ncbi:cytidylate kinase-like family protein [Lachnospiraceae bacterium 54-53]